MPEEMKDDLFDALQPALISCDRTSVYAWGPVFKAILTDENGDPAPAAIKKSWHDLVKINGLSEWQRTLSRSGIPVVQPLALRDLRLPVSAGDANWTAYPWISGRQWDGGIDDITASGRLLGRMHLVALGLEDRRLPDLQWPAREPDATQGAIETMRKVCAYEAAEDPSRGDRWEQWLRDLTVTPLPAIRDANLPGGPMTLDHRATNLIFTDDERLPTMIDFENAEVGPRLVDLAVAVLLFGSESDSNAGRLFDDQEWSAFLGGYVEAAPDFTVRERELWSTALHYVRVEWGIWHLGEGAQWELPGERGLLHDLLTADLEERFPLSV